MWKPDLKDFIADAQLARNLSNTWGQATLSTLRLLMRIVSDGRDLDIRPPMLDARDARRVEAHVRAGGRVKGRSDRMTMHGIQGVFKRIGRRCGREAKIHLHVSPASHAPKWIGRPLTEPLGSASWWQRCVATLRWIYAVLTRRQAFVDIA